MTSRAHDADQGQDHSRIGLGEELQVDANTESAGLRVPALVPEGRCGFGPQLALHHGDWSATSSDRYDAPVRGPDAHVSAHRKSAVHI